MKRLDMNEGSPTMAFSDSLIARNQPLWDTMQDHRFVREMADGSLPDVAFDRYLVYEGAFVATAVRIFAYAIAKSPSLDDQVWLSGVLSALLGEQFGFFDKAYAERGIDPSDADRSARGFTAFDRGMHEVGRDGQFADIVTAMYCAEWMYLEWCRRALAVSPKPGLPRDWIVLHTEEAFENQALWLKRRIDELASTMDEEHREQLVALFGTVVRLEIDFHTAAFG